MVEHCIPGAGYVKSACPGNTRSSNLSCVPGLKFSFFLKFNSDVQNIVSWDLFSFFCWLHQVFSQDSASEYTFYLYKYLCIYTETEIIF